MKELSKLINEYPTIIGLLFLIIGISLFAYKIYKKKSLKMKDYNVMSWKAMVNSWAVIVMLIVGGLFIIFK